MIRTSVTIRGAALLLAGALLADCSGASRMLPVSSAAISDSSRHRTIRTLLRIRIPRRSRSRLRIEHPSTISPLTQSVGIGINGGTAVVFNTTPTSPGCAIGSTGLVCTFAIAAPIGTDTFVATTYSAPSAGGTALDRGTATVPITKGQANSIAVSLGPVVSTTADANVGSLRYAIGTANPGDTIVFLLSAGSVIALNTPITIAGNVTIAGPGVSTGNITITGGSAHQIFIVHGTATISGLTLTSGKAATPGLAGGAILNTGSLTLANDSIGSSTSIVATRRHPIEAARGLRPHCSPNFAYGGAIYNDATLTISGTTFNGNIVNSDQTTCLSGYGGAIYNDLTGTLISSNDTYTNNSAMEGGAVYNAGIGIVSFTGDTFGSNTGCNAASGCPTTGCSGATCTTFATGEGVAIYDAGSGSTITNSTFSNNIAGGASNHSQGSGAALYFVNGLPVVTGSTFTNNLAGGGTAFCSQGGGGAIVVGASTTLELDNDTFTGNQAVGDSDGVGGAVAATGTVNGTNDTFTSNSATGSGSTCTPNGTGIGGAVYATQATLSNSTFSKNSAVANGQAEAGAVGANTALLTHDTFTSNSAVATATGGSNPTAAGGAVLSSTLAKLIGNTFTSNSVTDESTSGSSSAEGGAVAMTGSGILASNGNTFTSNTAAAAAGGTGTATGGGLAIVGTNTTLSNGDTFASNSVSGAATTSGGGALFSAPYILSNATFTSNSATGAQAIGGGLASSGSGQVQSSTFIGNSASGGSTFTVGGAIYDTGGITIVNSILKQNTAVLAGGGLFASVGSAITGTSILGNTVTNASVLSAGGGGAVLTGASTIATSTIAGNAVTLTGSGSGGGGIINASGLTLAQSTISGNTVTGTGGAGFGGGGILSAANLAATNSTISNNSTTGDGGGMLLLSNTESLLNVTIYQNAATGNGGGIDNKSSSTTLTNSIVAGGTAGTGPDINNAGTLTSGDYNIIQTPVAGTALAGTSANSLMVDPKLLALANNGGPTFTNADQANSPGTGHIPYSGGKCNLSTIAVDQRGYTRGTGLKCDVGAFEYNGVAAAIRRPALHPPAGRHHGKSPIVLPPLHFPVWTNL